jgi:signal transduction histidine kinase
MRRFRRLYWQMAASYALTTVVALSILLLVYIAGVFLVANVFLSQWVTWGLQSSAAQAATYFAAGTPDRAGLDAWMHESNPFLAPVLQEGSIVVLDRRGTVISSAGSRAPAPGTDFAPTLSERGRADLATVLGGRAPGGLSMDEPNGSLVVAVPMTGASGVEGAMLQRVDSRGPSLRFWLQFYAVEVVPASLLVIVVVGCATGAFFGVVTARRLSRRFARWPDTVERWSRGDFSTLVEDGSADEIGQVARSLDRMALLLRDLLQARRDLATLEERNRLARDLHDSLKQQVFAASMEISAARAGGDPAAAARSLAEAERLVQQAQRELATLIHARRPAAMGDRPLGPALADYVAGWSRQTGIAATTAFELDGAGLRPAVEEVAFRVAQEALANVARHSAATHVEVSLTAHDGTLTVAVADNGRGLDGSQGPDGVGLDSMRERAQGVGGRFDMRSAPGAGTTVSVRLPLEPVPA